MVDDNAEVRRVVSAVLAPMNPDIIECTDGASALLTYESHRPAVVLMDIAMDGLDGIQAAAKIIEMDPEARVVIVTSHDGDDLRDAAHRAGCCGYVLKDDLLTLPRVFDRLGCSPGPPAG